jgi:deoxyribodipyrimidine photo-lyase
MEVSLFWFRRDLRLEDNAGLWKALKSGYKVQPIFIFDPFILDKLEDRDDARVSFIHHRLELLDNQLRAFGSRLHVLYMPVLDAMQTLNQLYTVKNVFVNRDYEPYAKERDQGVYDFWSSLGVSMHGAKDHVIFEKNEVVKADGSPYLVFTPYSKAWRAKLTEYYASSYPTLEYASEFLIGEPIDIPSLEQMGFETTLIEFPESEVPQEIIKRYDETRNYPALAKSTTKLGVHLRFGTLSIRSLLQTALKLNSTFVNELIWRDFFAMALHYYPTSRAQSIKPKYDRIQWSNNESHFEAWCKGKTGYPLVDAGMRELNATGYMHNRVRMVVASFLTKHLLIDWRWGEAYFARKLLDFDLSSNIGGWQWASGSGLDAAPYFRVFNPTSQQEKFDPEYKYIKKWVKEWGTPYYPKPIVEHKWARERCLETFKSALSE